MTGPELRSSAAASPSLEVVRRIRVPQAIVDDIQEWLRIAGEQQCEGVGFWAGVQDGDKFAVTAAYIPRQLASKANGGVMVVIPGEELFRMNVWLYQQGLTLLAQVHSHPGEAYHSDTDDDFAVVSRVGGLSIVVPDYARHPFSLDSAAVYRLESLKGWVQLQKHEVHALIAITL